MNRRDRATATRLKVWPLLEAGLYPIPVDPESRRPLVPWGELDRLGYRPGVGEGLEGTLGAGPPDRWVPLIFEWWDRWPSAGAAILTGRSPRLKEWAYAGFAFDFLGVIVSHLLVGDAVHVLFLFVFFLVHMTSYLLWYKTAATRLLGSIAR